MQVELPFQRIKSLDSSDGSPVTDLFVTLEWPATLVMWLDRDSPHDILWLAPKLYEEESWDPLYLKIPLATMLVIRLTHWKDQPLRNIQLWAVDKPEGSSAFKVGNRRICTVRWDQHNMAGKLTMKLPARLPFESEGPAVDMRIALDKDDFFDVLDLLKRKARRLAPK